MVVDAAELDLLPQDEPELLRVGADAFGELAQGSALGALSLPAPGRGLAPASSERFGVSLASGSLALAGVGDRLQAPLRVAAAAPTGREHKPDARPDALVVALDDPCWIKSR